MTATSTQVHRHRHLSLGLSIGLTFLLLFVQAVFSSDEWQAYPLYGGEMTSIAIGAAELQTAGYIETVYVGTREAGVFKTVDGGQTWQPARMGLTFYPIRSLEVDPQDPNVLYAGTDFDGIWKSTNGGETWFKSSNGLDEGLIVFDIVFDPQDPETLYAGLGGGVGLVIGNIYKSEDGGATWEMKDDGIPRDSETSTYTNAILTLAIDPDNPAVLYAGTNFYGIFRTTDGGETWTAVNEGVPFLSYPDWWESVVALAVDPHHSNQPGAVIGGKYYVFNEVNGWELVSADYLGIFNAYLYYHPTHSSVIYLPNGLRGFSKSIDGGLTWNSFATGIFDVAFHTLSPDTIYGAHGGNSNDVGGVRKSSDQGESWLEAFQGITAQHVRSVAIDPQNADHIYAGTASGHFFRSQDGGSTWNRGHWHAQIFYDFGRIRDVAVDPLNSQNVYLASLSGLFKSTDQGETFDKIDQFLGAKCIAMVPQASGPIYVGADGIYKSPDGGTTWEQKNEGLPLIGGYVVSIFSLAIDPNQPDTVWAGTQYGGGIVKSTDGGEHWQVMGPTETNFVYAIAVKPGNSDEILAGGGFCQGSIYKSTDGGNTWQEKISDIAFVHDIVYDPRNPDWVYAATDGYGVLRSLDGGESWHDYSTGIFNPRLFSLDITGDDPPLLIGGSFGSGLYSILLDSTSPVLVSNSVNVTHSWQAVNLSATCTNPVVIIGPPTYHGTDPGVVRLRNVTDSFFDVRFQEWLYKDGAHTQENIPYLVFSGGRHQMANGSIWEAGTFSLLGTGAWTSHTFTDTFPSTPALFLTAQTYNGSDPITVRARNVTNAGFEAALFEEENKMDGHTTEEVGYLAVYSPQLSGTVNINGTDVPYLLQAQSVDHRFVPVLSSDIKLEEEQSKDTEINHCDETVSILALGDKIFTQDISSNGGDTIAIRRLAPEYNAAMEWGTVDGVDQNWMKIPLAKEYLNPVVVAKPVSSRGGDPGVIRIRNVSHNSFELRYNEWAYKDGWHTQERVFYMVAEAGERSVAGLTVEAGKLNTSKLLADGWEPITFSASFSQTPSVFSSVQTYNGVDPVTTRLRNCTAAGFYLTMDEEEAKNDGHTTETIGWIAIKKGTGNTADNRSVVALTNSTNHIPTQINFGQSMARRFPVVVSDMITTYGADPGFLRYQNLLPSSIDLFIQEEASLDTEMTHTTEDVSLFVGE